MVKMSQLQTPDFMIQKHSELTHQILEVNICRGDTKYYCQVYNWLWIIKRKEVGGYLKS